MLPDAVKRFIDIFSSLPSIGPRQATRLAFYLIKTGKASLSELAQVVADLKDLKPCSRCFFVSHDNLCFICSDKNRRRDVVMVVEKETDVISLEKTRKHNGLYLVLGGLGKTGVLDPEQKMKLGHLKARAPFTEIVLAINPTTYGDLNAQLIHEELGSCAKKVTRLGRGIPTGGEIEFADEDTLGGALDNRR